MKTKRLCKWAGAIRTNSDLSTVSRPALEFIQPLVLSLTQTLFLGIKWPEGECDCSPVLMPRIRIHGAYLHFTIHRQDVVLAKAQGQVIANILSLPHSSHSRPLSASNISVIPSISTQHFSDLHCHHTLFQCLRL